MSLNLDVTLPVSLTSFAAVKQNAITKLSWVTSQEINSKEFVVERSTDNGATWTIISIIPASGTSNSQRAYTAFDTNPFKGINLYRLRSVDTDNTFELSAIRKVNFTGGLTFGFYPNPVTDRLTITVDSGDGISGKMEVVNMQGQVVVSQVLKTTNATFTMELGGLTRGLYLLRYSNRNLTEVVHKFLKD
jgi:hypothetical protein